MSRLLIHTRMWKTPRHPWNLLSSMRLSMTRSRISTQAQEARAAQQKAYREHLREKNRRLVYYSCSVIIGAIGVTYASVPLYKIFCQATGFVSE